MARPRRRAAPARAHTATPPPGSSAALSPASAATIITHSHPSLRRPNAAESESALGVTTAESIIITQCVRQLMEGDIIDKFMNANSNAFKEHLRVALEDFFSGDQAADGSVVKKGWEIGRRVLLNNAEEGRVRRGFYLFWLVFERRKQLLRNGQVARGVPRPPAPAPALTPAAAVNGNGLADPETRRMLEELAILVRTNQEGNERDRAALCTRIGDVEATVAENTARMDTVEVTVAENTTRMDAVEVTVAENSIRMDIVEGTVVSVQATVTTAIAAVTSQLHTTHTRTLLAARNLPHNLTIHLRLFNSAPLPPSDRLYISFDPPSDIADYSHLAEVTLGNLPPYLFDHVYHTPLSATAIALTHMRPLLPFHHSTQAYNTHLTIILLGASGSGKSTLFDAIHEVAKGQAGVLVEQEAAVDLFTGLTSTTPKIAKTPANNNSSRGGRIVVLGHAGVNSGVTILDLPGDETSHDRNLIREGGAAMNRESNELAKALGDFREGLPAAVAGIKGKNYASKFAVRMLEAVKGRDGEGRRRLVTIVVCGGTGQAGQRGWAEVLQLMKTLKTRK